MKKSRYTEEQIIGILKQHESGVKTADLCREHGISEATFYNWKAKFGGLDVSEAQRLRQMEDENRRLKQLVADLSLDKEMLHCEHVGNPPPIPKKRANRPDFRYQRRRCRLRPHKSLPCILNRNFL